MATGQQSQQYDDDYFAMEEVDEENINWGKFLTRVFSILLLIIIICCAAVGAIYEKFYLLAALVSVALVCVFGFSFLDIEAFKTRTVEVFRMTGASRSSQQQTGPSTTNSLL